MKKFILLFTVLFLSQILAGQEKSNYEKYREAKDKASLSKDTVYVHDTIKEQPKKTVIHDNVNDYDYSCETYPIHPMFYYTWYPYYWYYPQYLIYRPYYKHHNYSTYHEHHNYPYHHDSPYHRYDSQPKSYYKYSNNAVVRQSVNAVIIRNDGHRRADYTPTYIKTQHNIRPLYNESRVYNSPSNNISRPSSSGNVVHSFNGGGGSRRR